MIDFHTHIIPNVDDGSNSETESALILLEAKKFGFNTIISTSHYYVSRYEATEEERKKRLAETIKYFDEKTEKNIDIKLASEIYMVPNMAQLIQEGKASTINNTKYVLFELSLNENPINLKDNIYNLIENGYVPIIAHPERYTFVQENPEVLLELIDIGVLFQANIASIEGYYGKRARTTVKKLLSGNLIHFLGSDVHRTNTVYPLVPEALHKIGAIVGRDRIEELTTLNAEIVLNNENIEAYIPTKMKRFLF